MIFNNSVLRAQKQAGIRSKLLYIDSIHLTILGLPK